MTSEADRIIEALGGSVDSKGKAAVPAASSVAPIEERAAVQEKMVEGAAGFFNGF